MSQSTLSVIAEKLSVLFSLKNEDSELEKTRRMLDDVLNTIPVRVFWKNLESVYLGCNKLFALDSGRKSSSEIIGLTDYDIRNTEQAESNREDDRNIIKSGKHRINYEEPFITTDGKQNWILTSKIPLRNSEGVMYGILGTYEDITERKNIEQELILQKNRLSNILIGSNVGTWEWNVQTGENIINDFWASIIGYNVGELPVNGENYWMDLVNPEDLENVNTLLQKHFNREADSFQCEFRMKHKKGHWVWVLSRGKVAAWTDDLKPILVCGTHLDITERKLAQEEIIRQLSEKDMILKETNHRIKNNLASIASILSLQADSVESPDAKTALKDAIGRVYSMQMLYEKLLFAGSSRGTSIKQYLEDLIDNIFNVFSEQQNIIIEKSICECSVNPGQVFYLGVIVNELLTNAMKYAFTGRDSGVIRISLKQDGEYLVLVIHDDGIGMPDHETESKGSGFGIMLINILTEQLKGSFSFQNDNGVKGTLKFTNR